MATVTGNHDPGSADARLGKPAPRREGREALGVAECLPGWSAPISRRSALSLAALPLAAILSSVLPGQAHAARDRGRAPGNPPGSTRHETVPGDPNHGEPMRIHYLEIVTPDVEPACVLYARVYGVTFAEPDPNLGGARTAPLATGGMVGIRAPLNEGERPVARPYALVDDIEAAVAAAVAAGAGISLPPMEIPGHGTCAIVYQGGVESGLWQI